MRTRRVGRPRETVCLLALGPLNDKVNLHQVAARLNRWQVYYEFEVDSPLVNLPFPEIPRIGNNLPAFHPQQLFDYMEVTRRETCGDAVISGIVDSEVHEDLYSTSDYYNRSLIVSLRTAHLSEVIAQSGKTYAQYVALEIAAQLLSIQYRRVAGISADPCSCEPPWHRERLDCLFDYYGLTSGNVAKLMHPRISPRVEAELAQLEVGRNQIDATMSIVNRVSGRHFRETAAFVVRDPPTVMLAGGVTGALASQIVELPTKTTAAIVASAAAVLATRGLVYWRRGR